MSGRGRIVVAGSGALGLASALGLARAGFAVEVVDPAVDDNASGVAAGMLAPVFEAALDPAARDHFSLLMAARDLWPDFADRSGVLLDRRGALAVGSAAWLQDVESATSHLGVAVQPVDGPGVGARVPGLAASAGLFTAEDWRLDAAQAILALRAAAIAAGVKFRAGTVTDRGEFDLLLIATGASHSLAGIAPELARLTPIKGHILRFERAGPAGAAVRTEAGYAIPGTRALTVGATMEAGVGDPAVDPARAGPLAALGERLFPDVAGAPQRLSAGVRAATKDGLPMVGPSVAPSVLLAVGARRNGWLLAPLVAREVVGWANGGGGAYAGPLAPGRFNGEG